MKRLVFAAVAAGALGVAAWQFLPAKGDEAAPAKTAASGPAHPGKTVFDRWCTPCHAPGPRHPGTAALDAKYNGSVPAALEERTDLAPDTVKLFVRGGVSLMAPFRKTEISDADLDNLAEYLSKPKPAGEKPHD